MPSLLAVSSLGLVALGGYGVLALLRRMESWTQRRDLQVGILALPLASLVAGIAGLHHIAGRTCFLTVPPWDYTVGLAVPLVMGAVALGGVGLGMVRFGLMFSSVAGRGTPASPALRALADHLADQLGAPRARVLVCASGLPLAVTYGLRRPMLLLSTWMVDHLDRRELEAVIAHELGHVARRDYVVIWLATMLRDAFFYLPTTRIAYRQLQVEKELACDDLAVAMTKRPLALASALAKVWHHALGGPLLEAAQPFAEAGEWIEDRIARLMSSAECAARSGGTVAGGVGTPALVSLLTLPVAAAIVTLMPVGCGLGSLAGMLVR